MKLYLVRHAQAEDGFPDFERKLTEAGRERSRLLAKYLKPFLEGAHMVSSPAPRALETAQILHERIGLPGPIVQAPVLYEGQLVPIAQLVAGLDAEVAVLVGHEPTLSEIASKLTGGSSIELKKGGVIRVDDRRLRWVLDPRLLEKAAR